MALIGIAAAWIFGLVMVAAWGAEWWMAAVCVALLAPALARFWMWRIAAVVAMVIAAGVAGVRFQGWDERPLPALAEHLGDKVVITGKVEALPDPGMTVSRYRVGATQIHDTDGTRDVSGAVLVTVSQYTDWKRGATVRIEGVLEPAPVVEGFDYAAYLLRSDIVGTMFYPRTEVVDDAARWDIRARIDGWRSAMERALQRALPEPESSLAGGIVLGRDGGISPELYDDYRRSGLAHILAVSGSNVAVLTAMVFAVGIPLVGRNWAVIPAGLAAAAYVLLAGAEWPVVRAGIMAGIFLFGAWQGRQQTGLAALGAAVIAMTAIQPGAARDVGFQLSVAATAGLLVVGPWIYFVLGLALRRAGVETLIPSPVLYVVAISVSASLSTAPIAWVNFEEVSLVGPLANVVVEPLFGFAFGLSLATALAGVVWEPLGWAVGLLAYYPLALCSAAAGLFASVPGAAVWLPEGSATAAVAIFALLLIPGWLAFRYPPPELERMARPSRIRLVHRATTFAVGGAALVAVGWHSLLPLRGPAELEVAMLDVGQGDAILLTTPAGKHVLIDGGPSGLGLAQELGDALPHWKRRVDVLVLTHPQQDHIGGLPALLERYGVGQVYDSGSRNSTEAARLYEVAAPGRKALFAGDAFEIDGVEFEVLWPRAGFATGDLNDQSLVLLLRYGAVSLLFTGDIEAPAQRELLAALEPVTILKVPHHGADTNEPAFFGAVSPGIALVSVGEGNRFGHPREATLQMLEGATVYRTDVHGRVRLRTDGERIRVRTEAEAP